MEINRETLKQAKEDSKQYRDCIKDVKKYNPYQIPKTFKELYEYEILLSPLSLVGERIT